MPIPQRFSTSRLLRSAAPALLALGFAGCTGDEVKTLFDEDGVWAVIEYDLEGNGFNPVGDEREGAYMLNFHKKEGVVEAAGCQDGDGNASSVDSSFCHSDQDSIYVCNCFAYEFEDNVMTWVEFDPGAAIPPIPDDPGGGGDTDGGGMDGVTQILAGEVEGIASNKTLSPLPTGLFGASSVIDARVVIQQKSPTVWDNPPKKPPNEAPNCGCL